MEKYGNHEDSRTIRGVKRGEVWVGGLAGDVVVCVGRGRRLADGLFDG